MAHSHSSPEGRPCQLQELKFIQKSGVWLIWTGVWVLGQLFSPGALAREAKQGFARGFGLVQCGKEWSVVSRVPLENRKFLAAELD